MKEIKAYIKCSRVEDVINGLHRIGVENLTVIDVMALGSGMIDPHQSKYSIECVERYCDVAKLEITCSDRDADEIVKTVRSRAYSGEKGDGVIFVLDVQHAVKIRTGETGDGFLQPKRGAVIA